MNTTFMRRLSAVLLITFCIGGQGALRPADPVSKFKRLMNHPAVKLAALAGAGWVGAQFQKWYQGKVLLPAAYEVALRQRATEVRGEFADHVAGDVVVRQLQEATKKLQDAAEQARQELEERYSAALEKQRAYHQKVCCDYQYQGTEAECEAYEAALAHERGQRMALLNQMLRKGISLEDFKLLMAAHMPLAEEAFETFPFESLDVDVTNAGARQTLRNLVHSFKSKALILLKQLVPESYFTSESSDDGSTDSFLTVNEIGLLTELEKCREKYADTELNIALVYRALYNCLIHIKEVQKDELAALCKSIGHRGESIACMIESVWETLEITYLSTIISLLDLPEEDEIGYSVCESKSRSIKSMYWAIENIGSMYKNLIDLSVDAINEECRRAVGSIDASDGFADGGFSDMSVQ